MRELSLLTILFLSACTSETVSLHSIPVSSTSDANPEVYDHQLFKLEGIGLIDQKIMSFLMGLRPDGPIRATEYAIVQDFKSDERIYKASVIFDGVPQGDSVGGYRYDFKIRPKTERRVELLDAKTSWRCWEGRGHQDFSIEPCS